MSSCDRFDQSILGWFDGEAEELLLPSEAESCDTDVFGEGESSSGWFVRRGRAGGGAGLLLLALDDCLRGSGGGAPVVGVCCGGYGEENELLLGRSGEPLSWLMEVRGDRDGGGGGGAFFEASKFLLGWL